MKLELGCGQKLDNPDSDTIASSLAKMDWEEDIFAKLSRDKLNYIQASGTHREGFIMEYQDGSEDRFFQATEKVNIDALKTAFVAYARGDGTWQASARWQVVDPHAGEGGRLGVRVKLIIALAIVALFLVVMILSAVHGYYRRFH